MNTSRKFSLRNPLVVTFGAVLIVAGAGFAAARTMSGPPWAQESTEPTEEVDLAQVRTDVEDYFTAVENECGTAVLGEFDLGDEDTVMAFGALVDGLNAGQTSHMVQSVRVLLRNCADHPNEGLMNALYHHGLNWVRHFEHEQWLQEKFATKWPDGKPGKPDDADGPHGNPHDFATGEGPGNGHGNGHSK